MQTLVVGDIHGCYLELQTLLEKAGLGQAYAETVAWMGALPLCLEMEEAALAGHHNYARDEVGQSEPGQPCANDER